MKPIEITKQDRDFMREACRLAEENVIKHNGAPYAALIVKDGVIVARGVTSVTKDFDPTAHAEINAIRAACEAGETHSLKGCVVYSSCEPCPMCLSALYWAGVDRIYYGTTTDDAAAVDFFDGFIYNQFSKPADLRAIPEIHIDLPDNYKPFDLWRETPDKSMY